VTDFLDVGLLVPALTELTRRNTPEALQSSCKSKKWQSDQFLHGRKYAGKDATEEYEPIHPPDAITDNLDPSKHLGTIKPDTMASPPPPQPDASAPPPATVPVGQTSTSPSEPEEYVKPHIEQILSLHDFEAVARRTMNRRGWNYYSSGADDEVTLRENHNAYGRVWFRPRVLRNVSKVDFSTSIFGFKTSMPVYITATALGMSLYPD
jgi:L-lactate dehydrogenase (cytochrome)